MSSTDDPKSASPSEAEPREQCVPRQSRGTRFLGGALQLLAIGLCFETLLDPSDGVGLMLRLFLLAVVMSSVVLRVGWLTLIALQISLLIQEPSSQQLDRAPLGFAFALVAMLAVVIAMKLPYTHRYVTDCFLSFFNIETAGNKATSAAQTLAIMAIHMTLVAAIALFLLMKLPIRGQSESWLKWSLQNGQAIWPGALLIASTIAMLVIVREIAWRQLDRSQASLYLRSVQMIANYRDFIRFERQRRMRTRMSEAMKKTDSKGLK